jgi:hypothetical protein
MQAKGFKKSVRRYSGGVGARELPRLWSRDWKRAYGILTRDHPKEEAPKGWFRRTWYHTKTLFLELSYKLTPPRRILFVLCLILALLGLETEQVGPVEDEIEVYRHPVLIFVSVIGLVFLLILELADRVVFRDELEVARQLQRDLLPKKAPEVEGYEFAFSYSSANTIGGDYYDFLTLEDGRIALVVGDASGHGMAAAMLMAISNATLKLAADTDPAPLAVARMVNRALVGTGGPRAFLTLFYGLLEPRSGQLEYVCAGHPFPLLRRTDGELLKLGTGSYPLGLRSELELTPDSAHLGSGDLLLLFSDGIPEAIDEEGEAYGFERLERTFEPGGSPQQIHDRILADLERFEGDQTPQDDRSLVVIGR